MRKRCFMYASIFFSVIATALIAHGESRTFFRPRSAIEDVSLYLGLNNYNIYSAFYAPDNYTDGKDNTFFIAAGLFYQQSTNSKQLGEYFLPNNTSCVSIKENGSGDIGSLWFELIAPGTDLYSSTFTLKPQRSVVGAYFNYHQNFCRDERLWLDVKLAMYQATHKLRAHEDVISSPGISPGVSDALDYLSSEQFKYGKISNCASKVFGIDDIEIKLGYEVYQGQDSQLSVYASGLIPTANKSQPHAKKLFEAVVGRGHGAIGAGFNGGINFLDCVDTSLVLMADFSYQYLFKRNEKRSFDLCGNGDWSRYLKVIKNNDIQSMMVLDQLRIEPTPNTMTDSRPAVNYLTKSVGVTPGSVINFWTALHYQHRDWHVECGYNLWAKQAEKISLKNGTCDFGVGIFNLNNTPPAQTFTYSDTIKTPVTASTANISQSRTLHGIGPNDVVSDASFITLNLSDLNPESASHPSCLTNKLYAACACDVNTCRVPLNVGLGGSFEFAGRNALQQWGVWTNIQIIF